MKRKEREFGKLKERLNQLLIDKKDKKQSNHSSYASSSDRHFLFNTLIFSFSPNAMCRTVDTVMEVDLCVISLF